MNYAGGIVTELYDDVLLCNHLSLSDLCEIILMMRKACKRNWRELNS